VFQPSLRRRGFAKFCPSVPFFLVAWAAGPYLEVALNRERETERERERETDRERRTEREREQDGKKERERQR